MNFLGQYYLLHREIAKRLPQEYTNWLQKPQAHNKSQYLHVQWFYGFDFFSFHKFEHDMKSLITLNY